MPVTGSRFPPYLRPSRQPRRITAAGLAGSAMASVALAATGAATAAETLLVCLAGSTLTLVIAATTRSEQRFRLRTLLESADWLPSPLFSVATATRHIVDKRAEPEIISEARRLLLAVTEQFDELARGRIARPETDYDLLLAGARACHRRLQAVTSIPAGPNGTAWWDSEIGRRYWQANLDALGRGVAITRVFLYQKMDADLAALIMEQSRAGVTTLVAPHEEISAAGWPNLVVWDGRRAWESRLSGDPDNADEVSALSVSPANVFTVNERDVRRLVGTFRACAEAGRTVGS